MNGLAKHSGQSGCPLRKVVVGIDDHNGAPGAIAIARALAAGHGASVSAFHALSGPVSIS